MSSSVSWKMSEPLDKAVFIGDWNKTLPVQKKDSVALLYSEGKPILSAPLRGKSVSCVLRTMERHFHKLLDPSCSSTVRAIYQYIGFFLHGNNRKQLVDQFENGSLTIADLLRDGYEYYEGPLMRTRNGVWIYGTGS